MMLREQTPLREIQARLAERMREADAAPDLAARLGVMIGEARWLVDLSEAGEIVPVPDAIAPVPLTRDWLLGLVNLRGTLYAVADLERFCGRGFVVLAKDARLLAFSPRLNFNAALVVTRMLGLRNVASMRIDDTPASSDAPPWIGRTLVDADGHRWTELSLSRLTAAPEFMMVGR